MALENSDEEQLRFAAEHVRFLYDENAKIAAIFWELRHKMLTFCVTALVALTAIGGWIYDHDLGRYLAVPIILGAAIALVCFLLDLRTGEVLTHCYTAGAELERAIAKLTGAPFAELFEKGTITREGAMFHAIGKPRMGRGRLFPRFRWMLRAAYLIVAGLLTFFAVYELTHPIQ